VFLGVERALLLLMTPTVEPVPTQEENPSLLVPLFSPENENVVYANFKAVVSLASRKKKMN